MAKDFEDGVWRTVGGRRIFIKDGESLSSAMKKSGKFKSGKKVKVEGYSHKVDEDYEDRLAKYKEIQKDANKKYDNGEITKEERNKLIDDAHDKYIKQKETIESEQQEKYNKQSMIEAQNKIEKEFKNEGYLDEEEYYDKIAKKYAEIENRSTQDADIKDQMRTIKNELKENGSYNKLIKEAEKDYSKTEELDKEYDRAHGVYKKEEEKEKDVDYYLKKGDFDKADELIEKYGLEDEREEFIEGQNSRVRNDYRQFRKEAELTSKARDQIVNGYDDYDEAVRSFAEENNIRTIDAEDYFEIAGKKLGISRERLVGENYEEPKEKRLTQPPTTKENKALGKGLNDLGKEKLDDKTADRIFGGKKETDDFEKWKEQNNEKIASYYTDTYSKDLKNINERVWNNIAKDIYDEENLPRKINNEAYKKAFREYKAKHPNTKLDLQDFIDMSEGKKHN